MKARTSAVNTLKGLLVTAPAVLREQLQPLSTTRLIRTAASLEVGALTTPTAAAVLALRGLAQRITHLTSEADALTRQIDRLTAQAAPALRARLGVGPDTAAALLIAAGDSPDRLRSEAAFVALCGASPVDASSGRQQRYRLNRGGDRQANAALHHVVLTRLSCDSPTQAYAARRRAQGKTRREVVRCLKRYVARELFGLLTQLTQPADHPSVA